MNRVVWVIGAGSGIGAATARRLHEAGDTVVLSSRAASRLDAMIGQLGDRTSAEPLDVTDASAVRDAVTRIHRRHGRIDAVVLTAQTMAYGHAEDVPADVFDRVVDVATHGTANVARVVLPIFRNAGRGTLIIVNSLVGEIAVPGLSTYACAKWGQLGLARSLQLEVRDMKDVHVCIASPGAINTPIYEQAANYAGRAGHPPPPVRSADHAASVVVDCLRKPRRHVEIGPTNIITVLGYRLLPVIYRRIVGPLSRLIIFRGPETELTAGNVMAARPMGESESGPWTIIARRRKENTT